MALVITTASSASLSAIAPADQSGADGAAGSARDAFAGVLAGIRDTGNRAGRDASTRDRSGDETADPASSRSEAHRPAEPTGADLAMLAMLAPALPATTVTLLTAGCTVAEPSAVAAESAAGTGESGAAPAAPAGASAVAIGGGQPVSPAQQAVSAGSVPAVAAQAAAAAGLAGTDPAPGPQQANAARAVATGATPGTGPVTGTVVGAELPAPAALLSPSKAAGAASTALVEPGWTAPAAGAAGQVPGTPGTPGTPPGTPDSAAPAAVALPAGMQFAGLPGPTAGSLSGTATMPASTTPTKATPAKATPVSAASATATHALHRSGRGLAGPGEQPAVPGERADTPAGTGVPAGSVPAASAAPAGTVAAAAGDPSVQAAQVPAAQPVAAGQSTTAGSEPAHRHPAAELPLARQVAGPVLALRAGGDGSHQLIVALHPEDLGPVNVHVRIEGDLMTIQLASTSETAHDALRDALPQLRSELQSAGLNSSSVSVDLTGGGSGSGLGGSGPFANPRQGAGEPSRPGAAVPVADPTPAPPRHRGIGRNSTYTSAGLDRWL
jgi:flagellar hook-length control protein FliK